MRYVNLKTLLLKRYNWENGAELWKNQTLKKDFRNYFYVKCRYTEAPLVGFDTDIDHYRPKGEVKQYKSYYFNKPLGKSGYDWLINDAENYRACCIYANRPRGTGEKSSFFPLKQNSSLLTKNGAEDEQGMLLDPCSKIDVDMLCFIVGDVECSSQDTYNKERVKVSKNIYNLTDNDMKISRNKVWNEVETTIQEFSTQDISEKVCIRKLQDAVDRSSPFSSCAISAVNIFASDSIKSQLDLNL